MTHAHTRQNSPEKEPAIGRAKNIVGQFLAPVADRIGNPVGRATTLVQIAAALFVGLTLSQLFVTAMVQCLNNRINYFKVEKVAQLSEMIAFHEETRFYWYILYLIALATIAFWSRTLCAETRKTGLWGLRFGPGWAAACWFTPLLNFVVPYRLLCNLWVTNSHSSYGTFRISERPPKWMLPWWFMFVAGVFILPGATGAWQRAGEAVANFPPGFPDSVGNLHSEEIAGIVIETWRTVGQAMFLDLLSSALLIVWWFIAAILVNLVYLRHRVAVDDQRGLGANETTIEREHGGEAR